MVRRVPLLIAGGMAVVFLADLATPRGVAVWLFYLLPLLATFWWPRRTAPWMVAGASVLLIVLGLIWSPPGVSIELATLNRSFGTSVLVMTAFLIDRLKRADSQRQVSNARLRRIIDSNMVGLVFGDRDGNIADCNDSFLRSVGYDREDLRTGRSRWPRKRLALNDLPSEKATRHLVRPKQ